MWKLASMIVMCFWGLVMIGVAFWLSNNGSSVTGVIACLAYGAGYFLFSWEIYHDVSLQEHDLDSLRAPGETDEIASDAEFGVRFIPRNQRSSDTDRAQR